VKEQRAKSKIETSITDKKSKKVKKNNKQVENSSKKLENLELEEKISEAPDLDNLPGTNDEKED
jgi:hypothetical protein